MKRELNSYRLLLDLLVHNEWRNIALLRTSVKSCYQAVFSDSGDRDTLAMVTSELLENAMKYGAWQATDPNLIRLQVCSNDDKARVTVESPVIPDGKSVTSLMETLAWLQSFESPEQAYLARLNEIAEAADQGQESSESSRLGLVRIAYEGNCSLSAQFDDQKGILAVTATLQR